MQLSYPFLNIQKYPVAHLSYTWIYRTSHFLLFIALGIFAISCQSSEDVDSDSDPSIADIVSKSPYTKIETGLHHKKLVAENTDTTWQGIDDANRKEVKIKDSCSKEEYPGQVQDCLDQLIPVDFDRDGDLDLLVTAEQTVNQSGWLNNAPYFFIYTNDGNGNFTQTAKKSRSYSSYVTDVGDLNGDGIMDLAGYDFWDNSSWLILGTGDNQYGSTRYKAASGTHGAETYIVDYDNDQMNDLVYLSSGSAVNIALYVMKNRQNRLSYQKLIPANFGDELDSPTYGSSFHSLFIPLIDVNKDGFIEFLVQRQDERLITMMSNAEGNYTNNIVFHESVDTRSDRGRYENIPANLGIFTKQTADGEILILSTYLQSTYREYQLTAQNGLMEIRSINGSGDPSDYDGMVDLNNDGRVDLVQFDYYGEHFRYTLQNSTGNSFGSFIDIAYPNGTITKVGTTVYSVSSLQFTDFNGDNLKDIVVLTEDKSLEVNYITFYPGK